MARKSWWFLASGVISTVTGGIIGAKAADSDSVPQDIFIAAMVAFALNEAVSFTAAYFWSKEKPQNRWCNSYTLGAGLTMLTAATGFAAGNIAESKCEGSFTCIEAAAAWAAALGIHTVHALALACSEKQGYTPIS